MRVVARSIGSSMEKRMELSSGSDSHGLPEVEEQ